MTLDDNIQELYRRVQALEANKIASPGLTHQTDAFLGLMGGPGESPFPSNPTFASNALTPLHMFNPVLAPIGISFDDTVLEGDDTFIGVFQGLYYAIATLYFTSDPTGAKVYFNLDGSAAGASQMQTWLPGFPWGSAGISGVVSTPDNVVQNIAVINLATLVGSLPTDVLKVGVEVENASGLTLASFIPGGPTPADPGTSNLVIFPVARYYALA